MCVCVCVFVALLECDVGVSASLILCKVLVSSYKLVAMLLALVSYPQIYKVELKICSYCILKNVLDLKRNGSKRVVQNCIYRFVSVDSN